MIPVINVPHPFPWASQEPDRSALSALVNIFGVPFQVNAIEVDEDNQAVNEDYDGFIDCLCELNGNCNDFPAGKIDGRDYLIYLIPLSE